MILLFGGAVAGLVARRRWGNKKQTQG